ncbi:elongator complex protein 1 isoform X2 [Ooceraea biroi]|uniref:elongator complex protein 1 isoform X2 n=1 Tax=Ooceraea biroi TaxID=2015173 RepID=UPI000F08DA92|nr:elongator complex protein 1 isoform X2 [Ooceraea biroi]
MKNLTVDQYTSKAIYFLQDAEPDKISRIQCASDPSGYVHLYVMLDNDLYIITRDSDECVEKHSSIVERECTKVVGLEYCITIQELYCAYEDGDILKIEVSDSDGCKCDVARHFDDGLQCMKLSPDHEIIAVVTGVGTVILMVAGFEVVAKMDLYSSDLGSQQFVSVGWGRKETQFHGSLGKAAATIKQREEPNTNESNTCRTQISWRDDCELFAVYFVHPKTQQRCFRTYDKLGTLVCSNENLDEFGDAFAWKPSENLIATTMRSDDKLAFVFYEKNGLKLKNLTLPFDPSKLIVTDIFWSPDGSILTTTCKHVLEPHCTTLQLWTETNDHLYLKQTISFAADNPLLYATWAPEEFTDNKNRLILLSLKEFRALSFNWCVNRSRGQTADDLAVVGVIDGYKVLITAFRSAVVPPPLCHYTVDIKLPVNAIAFAPDVNDETSHVNSNMFCIITSDNNLFVCKRKIDPRIAYEIVKKYNIRCYDYITIEDTSYVLSHFLWYTKDTVLCSVVAPGLNDAVGVLRLRDMDSGEDGVITVELQGRPMGTSIQHIVASPDPDEAYVVSDGCVYKFTEKSVELTNIPLNETCCQVDVTKYGGKEKKYLVALTHTNRLLVDGCEFSKSILSYFIHTDALLFTTLQNTLICIPFLIKPMEQMKRDKFDYEHWAQHVKDDKVSSCDLPIGIQDVRRIERNSYILAVVPQGSRTILQMPRGNLECVEPRVLVVNIVKDYLNTCNYAKAFDYMRKQRMNFNLIYDHDPKLFTDNAEKFVESVASGEFLSLFLSSLTNEDVTKTIYSVSYVDLSKSSKQRRSDSEEIKVDKVMHICNLLRNVMEKRQNADELLHPILIALLKSQGEKGLAIALAKVKELIPLENAQECSLHVSAEKALNYLLNTVDINALYDTALSTYDLELATFIASKSQKDPREYLPFLNSLKVMDEHYRKYVVDIHLKNYESALVHIAKDLNRFDTCLKLICNHNLYQEALKLFEENTREYKLIAKRFAEYLIEQKMYHNAAKMFYKIHKLDRAAEAFILDGNWEDAILIFKQMELSPPDLWVRYERAARDLRANRKYDGAAMVLLNYLNNPEEAIAVLCEGRNWKHAMRVACDLYRPDLTETLIKPGINEHVNFLLLQLNKTKEDFLKYKSRLKLLRSRMSENRQLVYSEMFSLLKSMPNVMGKNNATGTLSDTISIADTVSTRNTETSIRSGRSYRSSKNRRKQERKLLSLKEGSMFEDFGLISALYYIIADVYKNIDEWTELLKILAKFNLEESARKLQDEINSFLCLAENSKSEIWDQNAPTSVQELMKKPNYTEAQIADLLAPVKSLEQFIFFPPETNVSCVDVI